MIALILNYENVNEKFLLEKKLVVVKFVIDFFIGTSSNPVYGQLIWIF